MTVKVERGFARCPVSGCAARKVLFIAVRKSAQFGTEYGLMGSDFRSLVPAWRGFPGQADIYREHGAYCDEHKTGMKISRIKATRTATPCSDKCLSAVGPNCECECAGKNHGKRAGASLS